MAVLDLFGLPVESNLAPYFLMERVSESDVFKLDFDDDVCNYKQNKVIATRILERKSMDTFGKVLTRFDDE